MSKQVLEYIVEILSTVEVASLIWILNPYKHRIYYNQAKTSKIVMQTAKLEMEIKKEKLKKLKLK